MSVLKQLKGITRRTIKYLTKDIYDVNSDETLDNIIKNINKTMVENKPISFIPVFNLVLGDDPLFSDESLDVVFAYLKGATLANMPVINVVQGLTGDGGTVTPIIYSFDSNAVLSFVIAIDSTDTSVSIAEDGDGSYTITTEAVGS